MTKNEKYRAAILRFTISACRFKSVARTWVLSSFDILPCPGGRPSGFGLKMEKRLRELSFFSFSIAGCFWDFWCSPVPLTARVFRLELSTTRRKKYDK